MWGTFANAWKNIGHFFPNFSNGNIFCRLNCFWQCDLITWYVACSEIFLTNWRSFDLENFNFVDCLPNIWNSLIIPTCKVGDYLKSFRIFSFWFPHIFTSYKNRFTFFLHAFHILVPCSSWSWNLKNFIFLPSQGHFVDHFRSWLYTHPKLKL